MDLRKAINTAGQTARPADRVQARPIAEYLRHVGRDDEADEHDRLRTPPPKLYRVSEIAHHLDVTRQTVHNYATIGLITEETRTPGGQRLFHESVFGRLHEIQRLKRTHRLHEIRRILDRQERRGPHIDEPTHTSHVADTINSTARDPQPKDSRRLDP